MKKKLFTLLTLLVLCVTGAWAEDYVWNISNLSTWTPTASGQTKTLESYDGLGGSAKKSASPATLTIKVGGTSDKIEASSKNFTIGETEYTLTNMYTPNGKTSSSRSIAISGISGKGTITVVAYIESNRIITMGTTSGDAASSTTTVKDIGTIVNSATTSVSSLEITSNLSAETTYYINTNNNKIHFYAIIWTPAPSSFTVTYNTNGGSGEIDNSTGASITLSDGTGFTAPSGYSFAGWNTAANGSGTDYAAGATVTTSLNLYAKWTQTVTLDANIANGGSGENGSAIAFYNGTALTSISHTTPASGNALVGYYTAATGGTKVLNADGTFASSNVSDYITSSAWTKTGATTLYAQYEEAAKYAVTHTLSNVTATSGATGDNAATQGAAYTAIFAPSAYYSLPDAVTVTIGGADATAGTDYIYTKASGTVAIPAAKVTGAIVITVTGVRNVCANPTITTGTTFNFANHGYPVTMTNNEDGSTLYYSINNEDWTEYTSTLYATATTHYYAKSVKANYDNGTADKNVTNTFDGSKAYVAWVYEQGYSEKINTVTRNYSFTDDKLAIALKDVYNVVPVEKEQATTMTTTDDIINADLIVCSEAVKGNQNLANSMEVFVGVKPMINLKIWNYGSGDAGNVRWAWGKAANVDDNGTITPASNIYKILNGVTLTDGKINMFDEIDGRVQNVTWTSEPANNVDMGANSHVAMHAIIDNSNLGKQFFGLGLSSYYRTSYSDNAKTLIKNVAAILIAGTERLDAEVSTVSSTVGANGYTTFACSYPLDLTDANRPEGLKAYKATRTGANLTFEKLNQTVPAGTGLLLLGETKGGTYNIPVVASSTAVEDNALIGVTSPVAKQSIENDTYFFVMKKAANADDPLKFAPITTAKAVTIPAGKAYIEVPNNELTNARELLISFSDGETTAINGIEEVAPVTKTRKVVKNGRLVIETANGEFTIDGARVK